MRRVLSSGWLLVALVTCAWTLWSVPGCTDDAEAVDSGINGSYNDFTAVDAGGGVSTDNSFGGVDADPPDADPDATTEDAAPPDASEPP